MMVSVFTNVPGDLGSIPSRVIQKTKKKKKKKKKVHYASLLNTQHYKVLILPHCKDTVGIFYSLPQADLATIRKRRKELSRKCGKQCTFLSCCKPSVLLSLLCRSEERSGKVEQSRERS